MSQGLKAGQTLQSGTYRVEKVLGQGSFGITYLATARFTTQGNLGRMDVEAKVAIKEFFMSEVNGRSDDGSTVEGSTGTVFTNYRKKFRKEAENLSKLSHPGIVKVFDVFDENNTTYYVMEFLEGRNLDDYIKQNRFLPEDEAISIIREVGSALAYMHSKKMLHLDIKPKNIMRKSDGAYYLIDFGLSKQFTDAGEPESSTSIGLGTPGYAPVEQSGYKQDGSFPATLDVYALGATMFKMLTGERPPEATYILNEGFPEKELTSRGVSENTLDVLERAMAPIKKQRLQSVEALLNGFEAEKTIIASVSVQTPPPNQTPPPEPIPIPIYDPEPKKKSASALASSFHSSDKWIWCVVAFAILIVGFVTWKIYSRTEQPPNGYLNGHEWVDLGLPSGTKWATCNVGASDSSDYGDYYVWGETSPKSDYAMTTCLDSLDINPTNWNDVVRENWGETWRMPTAVEIDELVWNCSWQWNQMNGKNGYVVRGPNGNSIFLPAAGCKHEDSTIDKGEYGSYWSSGSGEANTAYTLSFNDRYRYFDPRDCSIGRSVRPVTD